MSTVVSVLIDLLIILIVYEVGYRRGMASGKKEGGRVALAAAEEARILREAEVEVEAVVASMPEGEQRKQCLLLKSHGHPRLSELQVRAIAGLLEDDLQANQISGLEPRELEPPNSERLAFYTEWYPSTQKWGERQYLSQTTWVYLRQVIASRPRDGKYVFQYADRNGRVRIDDILLCVPSKDDASSDEKANDDDREA